VRSRRRISRLPGVRGLVRYPKVDLFTPHTLVAFLMECPAVTSSSATACVLLGQPPPTNQTMLKLLSPVAVLLPTPRYVIFAARNSAFWVESTPSTRPASMRAWCFHRGRVCSGTRVSQTRANTASPPSIRSIIPRRKCGGYWCGMWCSFRSPPSHNSHKQRPIFRGQINNL